MLIVIVQFHWLILLHKVEVIIFFEKFQSWPSIQSYFMTIGSGHYRAFVYCWLTSKRRIISNQSAFTLLANVKEIPGLTVIYLTRHLQSWSLCGILSVYIRAIRMPHKRQLHSACQSENSNVGSKSTHPNQFQNIVPLWASKCEAFHQTLFKTLWANKNYHIWRCVGTEIRNCKNVLLAISVLKDIRL